MPYDFCTRFTVKTRRLGHPRNYAERFTRFLVLRMVLTSVVLDVPSVPVQQYRSG